MIDVAEIYSLPANRFAAQHLKLLRQSPDPRMSPLLQLATAWLELAPATSFPWPEYRADLTTRAHELATDDQVWVMSLLTDDPEALWKECEGQPEPEKQRLLSEHLGALNRTLRQLETTFAVGKRLAENLYSSLRLHYPSFGHPSPSG